MHIQGRNVSAFGRGKRRSRLTRQLSGGFNKKISKVVPTNILFFSLTIILAGIALGISFFSPFFEVSDIIVTRDTVFVDIEEVQQTLSQVIGKNILFLPTEQLETDILNLFPSVETVHISKVYPKTIKAELKTHNVFALLKKRGSDEQYVLFDNGVLRASSVLGEDTKQVDGVLQIVVPTYEELGDGSQGVLDQVFPLGDKKQYLSQDMVDKISNLLDTFHKNFSEKDATIELFPLENEVHIMLQSGTRIMFWLDRDVDTQLFKLKTIAQGVDLYSGELAYVDLRIIDRVDICKKGASCSKSSITK